MNEKTKSIIAEIDKLIQEVLNSDEDVPQEVLDLIEEISDDIAALKAQDKAKSELEFSQKIDRLIEVVSENKAISSDTSKDIISAIQKMKIEAPVVNIEPPKVEVTVPKIEVPIIDPPEIPPTEVNFPDEMSIKKPSWLSILFNPVLDQLKQIQKALGSFKLPKSPREAIPVRLSDGEEFYKARGGGGYSYGGGGGVTTEISPTRMDSGKTTVTTAGTRVQMSNVIILSVTIKALSTNTGVIYVGGDDVAASNGFQLHAKESISLAIDNLNKIYLDSSINGEGISYIFVRE